MAEKQAKGTGKHLPKTTEEPLEHGVVVVEEGEEPEHHVGGKSQVKESEPHISKTAQVKEPEHHITKTVHAKEPEHHAAKAVHTKEPERKQVETVTEDSSLKQREYRDAQGNIHHHTQTYMEQHGGEKEHHTGTSETEKKKKS